MVNTVLSTVIGSPSYFLFIFNTRKITNFVLGMG